MQLQAVCIVGGRPKAPNVDTSHWCFLEAVLPGLVWGQQVDITEGAGFCPTSRWQPGCPRLTGQLCEAGQATDRIVHQQYSARAQLDAPQEQHYHLLKLALLYTAYKEQALLSVCPGSPPPPPVTKASGCSPSRDSSQSTAQPASATSTSSG